MSIKNTIFATVICAAIGVPTMYAAAADQWHFVVKNRTASNITKLQVSENNSTWRDFDVGAGIAAGETATMVWSASDTSGCNQWIRAKFADGATSVPVKEDFCHDLDAPIEFAE